MRRTQFYVSILAIFVLAVLPTMAYAAPPSPFVGHWQAIDVDESEIRLTIAGPPSGPFQITWTESYISYCSGEAGIVRGTGWLNDGDPNLLEADLHVECFTTGTSLDLHLTFRHHPGTGTLSTRYPGGMAVVWHRPGPPQPPPPALNLRVNYGHDWVESFYEAGHFVYLTVTEADGVTVRATTELFTEPKDFWGGEPGFQTVPEDWNPGLPDIQPYDWVYGWVDNGASAQVQIGDIGGLIDLTTDSIQGTITASWFSEEVSVECFPWGAPEPQPEIKYDAAQPSGLGTYYCSWAGEWEIQPWQDVGVGYFGPDGHWVANAFNIFLAPHFYVFPEWDYIIGWEWPAGTIVSAEVYHPGNEGDPDCEATAEMAHPEWSEEAYVAEFFMWESCDIQAGDRVLLSGDLATREHTVLPLQVTLLDTEANTIGGETEPGTQEVHAWVHGEDGTFLIVAPHADGNWTVDFSPFDLAPGMGGRAEQFDADGDATSVDWAVPLTLIVTSTEDVLADDGRCTLREAIIAANTNTPSGEMDGECPGGLESETDTIVLEADQTYSLTKDSTYEDDALDGDLDVWDNSPALDLVIRVEGGGTATLSQDASVDDRVLQNNGDLRIEGLTLTGGGSVEGGGGVQNYGMLTLQSCMISGNTAAHDGGGLSNASIVTIQGGSQITDNSASYSGGGVWNNETGTLVVEGGTISGNSAADGGGGIANAGMLTVDGSAVSDNTATNDGGGLQNRDTGTALIQNASGFSGNSADWGGGIWNVGMLTVDTSTLGGNTANVNGGGVWNMGTLTVDASVVTSNSTTYGGGGLFNVGTATIQNGSVFGGDPNAGEGNTANYGGGIAVWVGSVTVSSSTVSGNSVSWDGGGIYNWTGDVTIQNDSIISNNSAANDGGGLHNHSTMMVDASEVRDNRAINGGGGMGNDGGSLTLTNSTVSTNSSSYGGGMANWPDSTLTVDASTFTANAATDGGGVNNHGTATIRSGSQIVDNTANWVGGGISNLSGGVLLVEGASAISGNSSGAFAGGIYNDPASTLTVNSSTISGNESVYGGGGLMNEGTLTADNSILSANTSSQGGGLYNPGTAAIMNSVVGGPDVGAGNVAGEGGGGLFNLGSLTVDSSTVSGNWAPCGGGLFNWTGGILTISHSMVSFNSANEGGGLHNKEDSTTVIQNGSVISGNSAAWTGGGLDNWGILIMTGSALLGNTSLGEGDAISSGVNVENATSITGNCVVGNGDTAVFNSQPAFQNATGNWWGDPSGPSGEGPGSGDSVSPNVDFSGWLTEPPSICASDRGL